MLTIIHYNEIGLKGKNRGFFEKKLIENIKKKIKGVKAVDRRYGKIIIEFETEKENDELIKQLALIPGVSSFAFPLRANSSEKDIVDKTIELLSAKKFDTFRVTTTRSNKLFPKNSNEVNILLGDAIRKHFNRKVDLSHPELTLRVEITEKETLINDQKFKGIGGLPVSSSGKVVTLLSGGIDSPVAAYLMAKRGLKNIFCHVQNKTMGGDREGKEKIKKLVAQLAEIQGESKLYIVPFEEIQKAIIAFVPAEFRMIIYRRFMMRIAQAIAGLEKAKGIVTGDCVGQVASQTIENINCVYEGLELPILPPLMGMNKEEIIEIAKKIGTYELSIIPYPDCCSFLIAKHPETRARIEKIKTLENLISNKETLIDNCIKKANQMKI